MSTTRALVEGGTAAGSLVRRTLMHLGAWLVLLLRPLLLVATARVNGLRNSSLFTPSTITKPPRLTQGCGLTVWDTKLRITPR